MTETDWLASKDPADMIRHLTTSQTTPHLPVRWGGLTDDQLEFFVRECRRISGDSDPGRATEDGISWEDAAWGWCHILTDKPTRAEIAAIFRDILGNPFRPVRWKAGHPFPGEISVTLAAQQWRTEAVCKIAQSIYEQNAFAARMS